MLHFSGIILRVESSVIYPRTKAMGLDPYGQNGLWNYDSLFWWANTCLWIQTCSEKGAWLLENEFKRDVILVSLDLYAYYSCIVTLLFKQHYGERIIVQHGPLNVCKSNQQIFFLRTDRTLYTTHDVLTQMPVTRTTLQLTTFSPQRAVLMPCVRPAPAITPSLDKKLLNWTATCAHDWLYNRGVKQRDWTTRRRSAKRL